jgi:hypothetical protein
LISFSSFQRKPTKTRRSHLKGALMAQRVQMELIDATVVDDFPVERDGSFRGEQKLLKLRV